MLCRVLPSALPLLAVSGCFSCLWALLLHIKEGEADVAVVLMTMALTSGSLTRGNTNADHRAPFKWKEEGNHLHKGSLNELVKLLEWM